MSKLKAPLWEFYIPFSQYFSADGSPIVFSAGPTVPGAIRWMFNTVWMAVAAMLLTCATSALAGYALAKKRFVGRRLIFTLIVCAMALPKQVILIPLIREMSSLKLYNTLSAVVYPIVGWPFGVFLIKQFAESIPSEILEAARIDGASELKTFNRIVFPMIKPGVARLPSSRSSIRGTTIFMQLIMLSSTKNLTISLGIAKMQAEKTRQTLGSSWQAPPLPPCRSLSCFSFSRNILPRESRWAPSRADTQGVKTMKPET